LFDTSNTEYSFSLLPLQLAVEVMHNMRTIKQLSIEKEVLRQYSELIYPTLMSVI